MKPKIPELQQKLHLLLRELLKVDETEGLQKIEDFQALHQNDPYFTQIASVLKGKTAYCYSQLKRHEEAMAIYHELIEEEWQKEAPQTHSIGVNYLCIIKEQIYLGKNDEAKDLAIKVLREYELDWGLNMSILYDIMDSLISMDPFSDKILEIEKELGLETEPSMDLKEKIKLLHEENRRANNAYTKIILGDNTEAELKVKLREYADEEQVGFYRKLAERHLKSLN